MICEKAIVIASPEIATGSTRLRIGAIYIIELAAIAFIYFWLVKLGLTLASINPSASPVWPATGFALAILLLRGYRVWPAIFIGAFLANVSSAGSIDTSAAIATGNSLEGVVGALLINRWSGGVRTFTTPAGIVKFALISTAATAISPAIGVSSLYFGGYAEWARFGPIFVTWWLGDLAGALVVAPVLVLWADDPLTRAHASETIATFVVAASIGLIAFSPIIEQTVNRTPLAFLAVAPLVWAALRRDPRDTATAVLILAGFAVWGTSVGGGPFSWAGFNESFVLLVMFIVSAAIPSLMLSAMAAELRDSHATLERAIAELTYMNRRVAAGQLSASIAHEIGQPLVGMVTRANAALHWMRAEKPNLEKAEAALEAIVASGHHASDIITSVRAMFKSGAPQKVSTDINQVIQIVLSIVRVELQKHRVELQTRLSEHLPAVQGDKVLLQQVVLNLLMNAIESMHSVQPRVLKVQTDQTKSGMVRVLIEDTGKGIAPSNLDQILEPLFTTKATGMGMGLAICRSIIENHGGRIGVSPAVNKGSIFQFELPINAA
jgi:signal transduction histidine kinase